MVAKLDAYVSECKSRDYETSKKTAEFKKYMADNGLKDAKLECGISNFGDTSPVITINASDGSTYFINFKRKGKKDFVVSDIMEDANTPDGMKRKVIWPAPKVKK
jgi:hypothetical protein